jgi:hypothetical protein
MRIRTLSLIMPETSMTPKLAQIARFSQVGFKSAVVLRRHCFGYWFKGCLLAEEVAETARKS